jgi:hypothetical protein
MEDLIEKYIGNSKTLNEMPLEYQNKYNRVLFDFLPNDKTLPKFLKILDKKNLEIGIDWDWISATTIAIGSTAYKKIKSKLKKFDPVATPLKAI